MDDDVVDVRLGGLDQRKVERDDAARRATAPAGLERLDGQRGSATPNIPLFSLMIVVRYQCAEKLPSCQAEGRSQPLATVYHRGYDVEAFAMTTDVVRSVLVSRDPGILGGDAAFKGTRVPVVSLVDWLEGGYSLDEYLDNFPSVKREQAIAALEILRGVLLSE